MKRELSGGITSRKRFAGKSNFSAKQVSTTLLLLLLCLFMPSSVKAVTTTINFGPAATAAQKASDGDTTYETNFEMGANYSSISGANVGINMNYRNHSSAWTTVDITRLAFVFNSSGVGNADNTGAGFYLRRNGSVSDKPAGLYTGSSGNKLAVLGLKPGNKVKFTLNNSGKIKYVQSVHADEGNGDLYNYNGAELGSNPTLTINSLGDLIIEPTQGTYISSITIEEEIAEYEIRTNSDGSSEFWFTAPGTLEDNDFALPFMSVSMGSINDYLVVQGTSENDYAAHMIKTTGNGAGTETLETNGTNYQPSAGSFYAFKPTASGTVEVAGTLSGERVHLFVYSNGQWVERASNNVFYKETFTSNNFSFSVEKDKVYYLCINNQDTSEHGYAFHLHWFKFTNTFKVGKLAKVIDLTNVSDGSWIELTSVTGYNSYNIHTKRCSGNITPPASENYMIQNNFLYMKKPTFAEGTDNAGTVVIDVKTNGGDFVFVATFPYHADFGADPNDPTKTSIGHTWNFIDPRNSDSNIGNCWINDGWDTFNKGTVSGILSIGQYKDVNSPFRRETDNREWTEGWTIKDSQGNITDPMYKNVFDMEGDNADMIWETEGLWFETGTNLSCLYNEHDAISQTLTNPLDLQNMAEDPDRYVGLLADADGASSFTIPGLKDGDRVLICMKSGAKSGGDREAIFFNIEGAGDAVGTAIDPTYMYGAGGTEFIVHSGGTEGRYEGFYHFVKIGDGDMKFTMKRGAICKLMYIHIYSGKRIDTNRVLRGGTSSLLFLNDEGTAQADAAGGWYQMRFRSKGQQMDAKVLVCSGNLTDENSFATGKFDVNAAKTAVSFKSTVGEFGVFRLRLMDMDFVHDDPARNACDMPGQGYQYVCDFADRNFTVGYREKMSYPYTWDFTDMQTYSGTDIATENTNYPETTNKYERKGWDISLWGADGYMKIATGEDYEDDGDIFSQNKNGYGNQLYANDKIIPETKGLWFYMDNNSSKYNGCAQITADGLRFANTNLADGSHTPDWNYKMVVPSVPHNGAVYLRMKRDQSVKDTDISGGTPFLATKFHFGVASAEEKTSVSTSTEVIDGDGNSNSKYSFYQVPNSTDEYILAVMNTGDANHLTFTLNGWIVEKLAISEDAKTVNRLGWTTESRARVIDPALTSELTGYPFKTYIVTDASYANKTVTLEEVNVTTTKVVMPIAEDGDNNAYIIRNMLLDEERKEGDIAAPGRVQILNNGFHLFVPDMHDYVAGRQDGITNQKSVSAMGGNKLVSLVNSQTLNKKGSGNIYNYALTSQKNKVGDAVNQTYLDEIGFYRIADRTTSAGNLAYLPVDCSETQGTTGGGGAKMSIIFASIDEPVETVETAIEVPFEEIVGGSDAVYYNLNGQKLNGKPTKSGLYIMNGKKILVK